MTELKRTVRYAAASLFVVALLGFALDQPAKADDTQEIFVVVTSGDSETQMMAIVLSNQVVARGASVRVLLCSEGGRLGIVGEDFPSFEPAGRTPQELLQNLMANGVTVEVCAIFLPNSEYDEDHLIEGVGIAEPPPIAEYMLKPNVRYFTF